MNTSEFAVKALASAATAFVDALLAPIHERLAALEDADKDLLVELRTRRQISILFPEIFDFEYVAAVHNGHKSIKLGLEPGRCMVMEDRRTFPIIDVPEIILQCQIECLAGMIPGIDTLENVNSCPMHLGIESFDFEDEVIHEPMWIVLPIICPGAFSIKGVKEFFRIQWHVSPYRT